MLKSQIHNYLANHRGEHFLDLDVLDAIHRRDHTTAEAIAMAQALYDLETEGWIGSEPSTTAPGLRLYFDKANPYTAH